MLALASVLLRRFRLVKAAAISSSPIASALVGDGAFSGGDFAEDFAGGDFAADFAGGLVTAFFRGDLVSLGVDLLPLESFFDPVLASVLGFSGEALRSPPRTRAIVLVVLGGECGCWRKVCIGLWVADLGTDLPAPGRGNHTGI